MPALAQLSNAPGHSVNTMPEIEQNMQALLNTQLMIGERGSPEHEQVLQAFALDLVSDTEPFGKHMCTLGLLQWTFEYTIAGKLMWTHCAYEYNYKTPLLWIYYTKFYSYILSAFNVIFAMSTNYCMCLIYLIACCMTYGFYTDAMRAYLLKVLWYTFIWTQLTYMMLIYVHLIIMYACIHTCPRALLTHLIHWDPSFAYLCVSIYFNHPLAYLL